MTSSPISPAAAAAREDSRHDTGQFGIQAHLDSGLVDVSPTTSLPALIVDQDGLRRRFELDDGDATLDNYMAWQHAVFTELAPHLATGMVADQWWQYTVEQATFDHPGCRNLCAAMTVTEAFGPQFKIEATSITTRYVTDPDGTIRPLTGADQRATSPAQAGFGTFYLPPPDTDPSHDLYAADPDRYAIQMRDKLVASGFAASLGGPRLEKWNEFSTRCDQLDAVQARIRHQVETTTTVGPRRAAGKTPPVISSTQVFWATSDAEATLAATAMNQIGLVSARPEDLFTHTSKAA